MIVTEELKLKADIRARCARIIATLNSPYEQQTTDCLIKETEELFKYIMYNQKNDTNGK